MLTILLISDFPPHPFSPGPLFPSGHRVAVNRIEMTGEGKRGHGDNVKQPVPNDITAIVPERNQVGTIAKEEYLLKKHALTLTVLYLLSFQTPVQGQWLPTGGPEGGSCYAFTERGDTVFAGTYNGVFFSTDNGSSWHAANNGLHGLVSSLAVSGNSILAGTSNGIYRSTDNGSHWNRSNTGLTHTRVHCITVTGDSVFITTDNQYGRGYIHLSTDNGASWKQIKTVSENILGEIFFINGAIIAGTIDGCYLSGRDDTTFTKASPDLEHDDVACFAMRGTTLFAGLWSGGLLSSPDSGATWTAFDNSLSGKTVYTLTVRGNYLFAGIYNDGVYRSSDNGQTWSRTSTGLQKSSVKAFHGNGNNILAGTINEGIYRSSDDGASWVAVNAGFFARQVTSLIANDNDLFAGTSGGVFRSTDNGTSWIAMNNGLVDPDSVSSALITHLAVNNGALFAVSSSGPRRGIYRSTDSGTSWAPAGSGLPSSGISGFTVNDNTLFAATWEDVYRSTDNGASWTPADSGLPQPRVTSLIASEGTVFATIVDGEAGPGGAYHSTDNGSSWTDISAGLPLDGEVISMIKSDTVILAGTYRGGIYRSTNNGASWTTDNSGPLTGRRIYSFAKASGAIFAGTYSVGIFLSTDNGASWTPVSTGLPQTDSGETTPVTSLLIHGDTLHAGTGYNSVWRRPLSEMISPISTSSRKQKNTAVQPDFRVGSGDCHRSDVVLSYRIQSSGFVHLGIYTIAGKKVEVVQRGKQASGTYRIKVKKTIPPGLYVVRFQAGNYQACSVLSVVK